VIVENPAGTDRCEATLTVIESLEKPSQKAPEFIVKLADKTANPKENVTFECKVVADPPADIQWLKDGQPLAEQPAKVRIEKNPDGVQKLILENIESIDQAVYKCVASNVAGKAETTGQLTVKSRFKFHFKHFTLSIKHHDHFFLFSSTTTQIHSSTNRPTSQVGRTNCSRMFG
jgi:hypothetical protein